MKDLVEFEELMRLLGYEDERSAKKWCKRNNVPVLKIGSKKYVLSKYLTQYIDNQLVIFVKPSSETETINEKVNQKTESQRSEAARKFLSKIKSN